VDANGSSVAGHDVGLRIAGDVLVIAWILLWIALALAVTRQVEGLTSVSDTIDAAATAVDGSADALGPLARVPIVGDQVRRTQARIRAAAALAWMDARTSRGDIRRLGALLGWTVAVAPTVPVAAAYGAFRVVDARRRRDRRRSARQGRPAPRRLAEAIRAPGSGR
jgi:hypothetical protein